MSMTLDEIIAACEGHDLPDEPWWYDAQEASVHGPKYPSGERPDVVVGESHTPYGVGNAAIGCFIAMARTELPRIAKRLKWLEGWGERVRSVLEDDPRYWETILLPLSEEYDAGPAESHGLLSVEGRGGDDRLPDVGAATCNHEWEDSASFVHLRCKKCGKGHTPTPEEMYARHYHHDAEVPAYAGGASYHNGYVNAISAERARAAIEQNKGPTLGGMRHG